MQDHQLQRASWHDYTKPCRYMITLKKHPTAAPYSTIKIKNASHPLTPQNLYTQWSPIGKIIADTLYHISSVYPEITVEQYVVMPDHVHLLICMRQNINEHLGCFIARIKVNIERDAGTTGLFEAGYNDQILKPSRSLDTLYRYIRENPYRLAVRREYPMFFRRINRITIFGEECQAYGNLQLLDNPFKEAVIVHRSDDAAMRNRKRELWLYTAANGGVLISPFISPAEKQIRAEAESLGGKTILLTNRPLAEREKPSAHDFEQCTKGRLLLIAPTTLHEDSTLSRASCLAMNRIAQAIADEQSKLTI